MVWEHIANIETVDNALLNEDIRNVLICFDENLLEEAAVLLAGLAECVPNLNLHCITALNVSQSSKERLLKIASVLQVPIFFYPPKLLEGKFSENDKALIRFQKLIFNEIMPSGLQNLLYLDIDTLPVGNLTELFQLKFNQAFAAVSLEDFISRRFVRWKSVANAGVILFNVSVWNKEKLNQHARNYISKYHKNTGKYLHSDELVLNKIYYAKWFRLSSNYNCTFLQTYTSMKLFQPQKIKIIHFIGPKKIWKASWKSPAYIRFLIIYRSRLRRCQSISTMTDTN